ncbi:FIST C-terminal domain-containing protein [Quatrionicoccus australiensis]|nr:FIST C-terminal domain-containing protein [Quatrionicoccus australiensis]
MALVVFFCSSNYDLERLAEALNRLFAGVRVIGCTTAGEIGPAGYRDHSLSGFSFSATGGKAVSGLLPDLQNFTNARGQAFTQDLTQQLEELTAHDHQANTFAFLMIDGLSIREEPVVHTLQSALRGIPLCGGSAGDDLKFVHTWVFHDGAFHTDSAVLLLLSTPLPFRMFKTQHFISDQERLVVTEADAEHRIVKEINGLPAADEYARILGIKHAELDAAHFAATPVVVVIDGTDYVRSIQQANPDGSLRFYCAIEEGLILRVARGADLLANLVEAFDGIRKEIGPPLLTLGCDCILRNQEITQKNLKEKAGAEFMRNNAVGFSTYGEQYGSVHVNQTFTGIAIGSPDWKK